MSDLNLSEREREEIVGYIQRGQRLPPKYKALLFEQPNAAELIWPGKTSEVTNVVLPFQQIEQIDEPRKEGSEFADLFAWDQRTGRQTGGWTNKLIWGDNKLVLSSLKNGPLRRQIEAAGGLKLAYIDPPFDVGADFSFDVEVGGEFLNKQPSLIEDIAYRDTWGRGADSFASMIYERISLIHSLLATGGSLYVHCDYRVNFIIRSVMDELFGQSNMLGEIAFKRRHGHSDASTLGKVHDTIFVYSKSAQYTWNPQYTPYTDDYIQTYYRYSDPDGRKWLSRSTTAPRKTGVSYEWNGIKRISWR